MLYSPAVCSGLHVCAECCETLACQVRQLVESAGGTLLAWHPAIGTAVAASQNTGFSPKAVAKVRRQTVSVRLSHSSLALYLHLCTHYLLPKRQLSMSIVS